jgi:hypothetical protein
VIRDGFDDELDELRATAREGREWVADLEARERERTGIENLEVGYTQVHGYYIEVTNSHLDAVPEEYTRRQTLKNSERFYTPALKRREDEILGAEERADSLGPSANGSPTPATGFRRWRTPSPDWTRSRGWRQSPSTATTRDRPCSTRRETNLATPQTTDSASKAVATPLSNGRSRSSSRTTPGSRGGVSASSRGRT